VRLSFDNPPEHPASGALVHTRPRDGLPVVRAVVHFFSGKISSSVVNLCMLAHM
jgi:hypothetical protein